MTIKEELDPPFKAAYENWITKHRKEAGGNRKMRLGRSREEAFAEMQFLARVWWPAIGRFDHLFPEFEVRDFKDGYRYLDFAYLVKGLKICIEIDPFGTHHRDIDRWKYADNLIRHNHLMIDDWKIIRFSLDHITNNPRLCQQLLQQALGKWGLICDKADLPRDPIDRAIIEYMANLNQSVSPIQIAAELGWHRKTIAARLRGLLRDGRVVAGKLGAKRVRNYVLSGTYSSVQKEHSTKIRKQRTKAGE